MKASTGCWWQHVATSAHMLVGAVWRSPTSPDLEVWTLEPEPIYEPGNTFCPECPEMFKLGDTWYLVYSRFSEYAATVYRVADSPRGPWRTPEHDALDGRRWYAAKSLPLSDGERRVFFGWIADRVGSSDRGAWRWGGDFAVPRTVSSSASGSLDVGLPEGIEATLGERIEVGEGTVSRSARWVVPSTSSLISPSRRSPTDTCWIACCGQPLTHRSSDCCSVMDDELAGYAVTFDRGRRTISLVAWPQPASPPWSESVGYASVVEPDGPRLVEMPLNSFAETLRCRLVVQDSLFELYVNDSVAISYRVYDRAAHELGFYASDGRLRIESSDREAVPEQPTRDS